LRNGVRTGCRHSKRDGDCKNWQAQFVEFVR
jgi:hypothetical protein